MVWWFYDRAGLEAWVRVGPYFDFNQNPWRSISRGVIYSLSMVISLRLGMRFARRYFPLRTGLQTLAHVVILSVFSGTAFALVSVWVCAPETDEGFAPSLWIIAGIAFTFSFIFSAASYVFDLYQRLRQAEREALQAELSALRAQINPHFLFNALNTIAALVRAHPAQAEEITEELADLFRYVLRSSQTATVSLVEELESARMYLAIEQARFGPRLAVQFAVSPGLENVEVPSLVLQPLVENAVKHGAGNTEGICTLRVGVEESSAGVELSVRDSGPGFASTDPADVFGNGTGLTNVRQRLHLLFGTRAELEIRRNGVSLHFPKQLVRSPANLSPYDGHRFPKPALA